MDIACCNDCSLIVIAVGTVLGEHPFYHLALLL
jgi:hypothetical protein